MHWQEEVNKKLRRDKRASFFEGLVMGVALTMIIFFWILSAQPDTPNCSKPTSAHGSTGQVYNVWVCREPEVARG